MSDMYKKIKRQNGEKFAQTIRNYHDGLFEIEGIDEIVRHAGRDARPLLPYLMGLLASNDDVAPLAPEDPFILLDRAGYDAFYADTLEKQNSIKPYFSKGELLCTFNDSARYKNYHIVHAVKKEVGRISRGDFKGKERREDVYGTSVISIQMLKKGGFISIKNRYNHSVPACDNTFNSNPDNIIEGLSAALKDRFDVVFNEAKSALPDNFVIIDGRVFKYHAERNGIYYGDQAWVKDGVIYEVNRSSGDALFDYFLFDNKTKALSKVDPQIEDSFAEDFNRDYGANRGLYVQDGNLMLADEMLLGTQESCLTTLCLPALKTMGKGSLSYARSLKQFDTASLTSMDDQCLYNAPVLYQFSAPKLKTIGNACFHQVYVLPQFSAPALTTIGTHCFSTAYRLSRFEAPALSAIGANSFEYVTELREVNVPSLRTLGVCCFFRATNLKKFNAPSLIEIGRLGFQKAPLLTQFTLNARCAFNRRVSQVFAKPQPAKILRP